MFARTRAILSGSASIAAVLVAAAPASASTTLGQTAAPNSACAPGLTALQSGTGAAPAYRVPAAGVLTSWSYQAAANATGEVIELKVFRPPASGGAYFVVGESAAQPVVPGMNTFPTRIPVQTGDVLGLYDPSGSQSSGGGCAFTTTTAADSIAGVVSSSSDPAPPGSSFTPTGSQGNIRLDISAVFEPDADADGFGDETQDQCPTNAGTQGPCPPPPPKDTTPPAISIAAKTATLSKRGSIAFLMTSNEAATGTVSGAISVPKAAKVVRFRAAKVNLAPGKLTKVTLRLSRRSAAAVRSALKHHKLKAKVTIAVKDAATNVTTKKLTLRLRR